MNELSSLGLILLFALAAGHLARHLRIPEVTGYILAGVAVGPAGLGWVSQDNLAALQVFSEVALGLILFSIGSIFHYERVVSIGRAVLRVTLTESVLAGGLVAAAMLVSGQGWRVSLLLGAIAIETAAASTLMVVRECNAKGPLTDTLLGIIGINNILALTAFALAGAAIEVAAGVGGGHLLATLYRSAFFFFWQLAGSVALGFLVGILLAAWVARVTEHGEVLMLLTGAVLLCVGLAMVLDLSTLVASMAVGATMVNLSTHTPRAFETFSRSDPPFFAILFVIAGADLHVGNLTSLGAVGLLYVVARAGGKFLGARAGARKAGLSENVQRHLGFGIMSQAGLAIGLTLVVSRRFPDVAPAVSTVVLAAVVVFEMVGPISVRMALDRSGESQRMPAEPAGAVGD